MDGYIRWTATSLVCYIRWTATSDRLGCYIRWKMQEFCWKHYGQYQSFSQHDPHLLSIPFSHSVSPSLPTCRPNVPYCFAIFLHALFPTAPYCPHMSSDNKALQIYRHSHPQVCLQLVHTSCFRLPVYSLQSSVGRDGLDTWTVGCS